MTRFLRNAQQRRVVKQYFYFTYKIKIFDTVYIFFIDKTCHIVTFLFMLAEQFSLINRSEIASCKIMMPNFMLPLLQFTT